MSVLKSFIVYDGLPLKSGGGHQLNKHSNDEIFDSITQFIALYTDSKTSYVSISMTQFKLGQLLKNSLRFGFPRFHFWSYMAIRKNLVSWNVSSRSLERKISLITADDNLLIAILWRFYFVNPETGEVLPGQKELPVVEIRKPQSEVYVRLSNSSKTVSVWFALPFEELNEGELNYINALKGALPFRFSSKSWRTYQRSKDDSWFARKLEV
ncbi:hypothetical protein [Pedobacter frigoris]|nr:hypothetical protein [Pedobacter frigoris]